ncbi:chloride channel protein [Spirochaetota bacterium]
MIKIYHLLSNRTVALIERVKMTESMFMIIAALIIGTLGGFGAIFVRFSIKTISSFSFPGSSDLLSNIIASPWYVKLIVPSVGGLIVGPVIYFFAKEAKGHGVPEVMQSIILKGGKIRPRVAIVKAIASAITIGTGGSVGREGPIVQIGSGIGSSIGQFFKVSAVRMRTLVGCGAAAGIAAAFNAPIAGALFSTEIILQDFTFSRFSPIVVSSVMATVISHSVEGNFSAFRVPDYKLTSPYELFFYFLLAILCALAANLFMKLLYYFEDLFDEKIKIPEYTKPFIGGLLIGAIALIIPEVMGVGYESINNALHGKTIWHLAIILIFIKILATSITLGSGGSGGVFAPSLFIGAMTGVAFGSIIHGIFPNITSMPGAYALVAMGGLVAATTHAPITAIIIVFELTNDYNIILPLMITCIISTIISKKISRESIYTLKLVQRNIHIKDGAEINIMKSIFARDVYTKKYEVVDAKSSFDEVVNSVVSGQDPYLPVVNKNGNLVGILSIHDVKEHLLNRDILKDLLIAGDIINRDFESATVDDNCQDVLDKLSRSNMPVIPVVDPKKTKKLLGMIWRRDVMNAYNKEIERRELASSFASKITMKNIDSEVHFLEGYAMTEIPVPKIFIGNAIKKLNIRSEYGVDILLIRNNTESGSKIKAMASPDYVFSYDDSIVISGEVGKIELMKLL